MAFAAAFARAAACEKAAMMTLARHRDTVALDKATSRAYAAAFPIGRTEGRVVLEADDSPLALGTLAAVAGGARHAFAVAGTRLARGTAEAALRANFADSTDGGASVVAAPEHALAACSARGLPAPSVVCGALTDVAALRPWAWHSLLAARDAVSAAVSDQRRPPAVLPGTVTLRAALATLRDVEAQCLASARGEHRAVAELPGAEGDAVGAEVGGLFDLRGAFTEGDAGFVSGRAWLDDVPRAALHRIQPARAVVDLASLDAAAVGAPLHLSVPLGFPAKAAAECGATALVVWAVATANGVVFSSEPPLGPKARKAPLLAAPVTPQTVLFLPHGVAAASVGGTLDVILPADPCADGPCFAIRDAQGNLLCAYT